MLKEAQFEISAATKVEMEEVKQLASSDGCISELIPGFLAPTYLLLADLSCTGD
jgi:hypothetical protein